MNKKSKIKAFFDKLCFWKRDINIFLSDKLPKDFKQIIVVPTYKCNLSCSYCYAQNIKDHIKRNMDFDDFKKLIGWIKKQKIKQILFAGGEPSEHPNFLEMIDLCKKKKIYFKILTNNLFNYKILKKLKDCKFISDNVINYNPRRFYSKTNYKIFHDNLKKMFNLRIPFYFYCNIKKSDKLSDYDELIKDAKNYDATIGICLNVPHNLDLDEEAKKLIYLVENAKKVGVDCVLKRPIPKCMLSKSRLKKIKKVIDKYYNYSVCDMGPFVVNPDLTILPCNSLFIKGPSVLSFKNVHKIFDHYRNDIESLSWKHLDRKCKNCEYFINHSCQGGCLVNKIVK